MELLYFVLGTGVQLESKNWPISKPIMEKVTPYWIYTKSKDCIWYTQDPDTYRYVLKVPEKVYFRSQILECPSTGEYWNISGVPVLPENVIFTFFRTCWCYSETYNTGTQKWSSIVQYSCTSIWDLKYTFSKVPLCHWFNTDFLTVHRYHQILCHTLGGQNSARSWNLNFSLAVVASNTPGGTLQLLHWAVVPVAVAAAYPHSHSSLAITTAILCYMRATTLHGSYLNFQ